MTQVDYLLGYMKGMQYINFKIIKFYNSNIIEYYMKQSQPFYPGN